MGQQFLSAPPASGGPTPPPPSAGSRSAWPPPPPPNGQQPGGPGFGQSGPGDPQLSDTMERMLRPQGLFQRPQPKQYDWNSEWTPGAATASTGPTPITGPGPSQGGPSQGGPSHPGGAPWPGQQQPTPPPGGPATASNPGLAPGGGAPQWGQSPTPPPGGQYPSGAAYQTGAVAPAGGPTPPPPGYPAGGPPTTIDRFPGPGQYGPGGQFTGGQAGPGTYAQPALPPNGQGGQFPPGQYGAGPHGQTTYAQGQYGTGQFGPGQLAPGQYGVDQYGATQVVQPYPDGQYGPGAVPGGPYGPGGPGGPGAPGGQYGLPGQYGPDGQFGPDGSPADGHKRPLTFGKITLPRSPLILAIAGAALVAIVAIAVISLSGNPGTPSGTSTAAGGGATPSATSSATGQSLTERQAAAQLAALLKQSGSDHAAVTDAVVNVEKCGKNLGADAQTFSTSAANRQSLLAKLADLPGRSSLPSAMVSDLSGAWQASAAVDTDLAKWASHAATAGCHGGDLNYSSYKASINDDTPATNDKQAFVSAWNPLAKQDGLPTYQAAQL
jgi:hypothetical protein